MAIHCPECGFTNADSASYCKKCGAFIDDGADPGTERSGTTATYEVDAAGELVPVDLGVATEQGAVLVVRAGGGRVGESFRLDDDRMTIGRRPDAEVFLDDVTVSRDHALIVQRADGFHLDDLGSLNGTYVNRSRIESHKLEDGDELQIGKYKLTFLD